MRETQRKNILTWISDEAVVEALRHRFGSIIEDLTNREEAKGETTLDVIMAFALSKTPDEIAEANKAASLTKSLQNNVGLFHQDILGGAEGWVSTGTAGGDYDLHGESKIAKMDKAIYAEVKMRYNTIRGKDKATIWKELDRAVRRNGGKEKAVGYLIEIVPARNDSYDKVWKFTATEEVNGSDKKVSYNQNHVRRVDGVTAYHMVTGEENAIFNLLHALPQYLFKAFPDIHNDEDKKKIVENIENFLDSSIKRTLGSQSFYAENKSA